MSEEHPTMPLANALLTRKDQECFSILFEHPPYLSKCPINVWYMFEYLVTNDEIKKRIRVG